MLTQEVIDTFAGTVPQETDGLEREESSDGSETIRDNERGSATESRNSSPATGEQTPERLLVKMLYSGTPSNCQEPAVPCSCSVCRVYREEAARAKTTLGQYARLSEFLGQSLSRIASLTRRHHEAQTKVYSASWKDDSGIIESQWRDAGGDIPASQIRLSKRVEEYRWQRYLETQQNGAIGATGPWAAAVSNVFVPSPMPAPSANSGVCWNGPSLSQQQNEIECFLRRERQAQRHHVHAR